MEDRTEHQVVYGRPKVRAAPQYLGNLRFSCATIHAATNDCTTISKALTSWQHNAKNTPIQVDPAASTISPIIYNALQAAHTRFGITGKVLIEQLRELREAYFEAARGRSYLACIAGDLRRTIENCMRHSKTRADEIRTIVTNMFLGTEFSYGGEPCGMIISRNQCVLVWKYLRGQRRGRPKSIVYSPNGECMHFTCNWPDIHYMPTDSPQCKSCDDQTVHVVAQADEVAADAAARGLALPDVVSGLFDA